MVRWALQAFEDVACAGEAYCVLFSYVYRPHLVRLRSRGRLQQSSCSRARRPLASGKADVAVQILHPDWPWRVSVRVEGESTLEQRRSDGGSMAILLFDVSTVLWVLGGLSG